MRYKLVLTSIAILTAFLLPTQVAKLTADGIPRDNVAPAKPVATLQAVATTIPTITPVPTAKPASTPKIAPQTAPSGTCADWVRAAGIGDVASALDLIRRESGCRVNAYNPSGAYGIPQALPGSKMASAGADWRTNPITQLRWMNSYVLGRYGSWANALGHSYSKGWY